MPETFTWNDEPGPRYRRAWLLLIKGDEIRAFDGTSMPGWVAVVGTDYEKRGKWSNTTYRLLLADGVRYYAGRDGWETGTFREALKADTWRQAADVLGVSVPALKSFLAEWRPSASTHYDHVDAAMEAVEGDCQLVTVDFGAPTNREQAAGYWDREFAIPGTEGRIKKIDPELGWVKGNVEVVGVEGRVVDVKYSPGYHGGYYAVLVAVPVIVSYDGEYEEVEP